MIRKLLLARSVIQEAGEGHRWDFDYTNFKTDPNPDVLVLGAFTHPKTNNELVGAINLNGLNERDLNDLRRLLPDISKMQSLKNRYRYGKRMLPYVFDNFYRTYNTEYIVNLKRGTLFPIYGVLRKDTRTSKAAARRKAKDEKANKELIKAKTDIRNIEKAYDNELAKRISLITPDVSKQNAAEKDIIDRYAATQYPTDQQKVDKARKDLELKYADERDSLTGSVSGETDPRTPPLETPAQAEMQVAQQTDSSSIEKPVTPEEDPIISREREETNRKLRDYERALDVSKQIDATQPEPIKSPTKEEIVDTSSKLTSHNVRELPNNDQADIENTNDELRAGEAELTNGVEIPKESIDRRTITYYSPRLKRYIVEAI